jgi:hypothetical protein
MDSTNDHLRWSGLQTSSRQSIAKRFTARGADQK